MFYKMMIYNVCSTAFVCSTITDAFYWNYMLSYFSIHHFWLQNLQKWISRQNVKQNIEREREWERRRHWVSSGGQHYYWSVLRVVFQHYCWSLLSVLTQHYWSPDDPCWWFSCLLLAAKWADHQWCWLSPASYLCLKVMLIIIIIISM